MAPVPQPLKTWINEKSETFKIPVHKMRIFGEKIGTHHNISPCLQNLSIVIILSPLCHNLYHFTKFLPINSPNKHICHQLL